MRYQAVVLGEEMQGACDILSVAWQRATSGNDQGHYYDVNIYMGLCASDQLGSVFEDNWVPGTKTLVFSTDQLDLSAGVNEWEPITLDAPYWYGGQQNLLLEVEWGSANTSYSFYTWKWDTGAVRSIKAVDLAAPSGIMSTQMSELQFTADLDLEVDTFGCIKTLFIGGEGRGE
jgi:hypothetical protein